LVAGPRWRLIVGRNVTLTLTLAMRVIYKCRLFVYEYTCIEPVQHRNLVLCGHSSMVVLNSASNAVAILHSSKENSECEDLKSSLQ
jgi:hypothetical protein